MVRLVNLIVILLLGLASTAFAQHKYIPFPDSNAIWVIKFIGDHGENEGASQTFIQKDTIINGIEYKKMVETSDSNLITPPGSHELWYALRQDPTERKVYIYDEMNGGGGKEKLFYDFSLKIGDTIPLGSWPLFANSVITNIDTIMIDTNEHLVFYSKHYINGQVLMPYIEGIGGTAGLLYRPFFFEGGTQLVCLMLGKDRNHYYTTPGETCKLYHYTGIEDQPANTQGAIIFPNPVTSGSVIKLNDIGEKILTLKIYDATGKLVEIRENVNRNAMKVSEVIIKPGLFYYALITTKGKVHSGKFIVAALGEN